jgi:hypothetical protein
MREQDHTWQVPGVGSPDPVAEAQAAQRADEAARSRRAYGWLAAAYVFTTLAVWWVNHEANFHEQLAARGRHANGVVTEVVSERRHRRLRWDYALKYRYEVRGALHTGKQPVRREQGLRARPGDFISVTYDPASPDRHLARPLAEALRSLAFASYVISALIVGMWGITLWALVHTHWAE